MNDYEAAFNAIGGGDWDRWLHSESGHARESRHTLIDRYAYAIPNDATLDRLAGLGPIVEMGAGAGYWAHLLRERGVDVIAYDQKPPIGDGHGNHWLRETRQTWTDVLVGGPEMLRQHRDRTLFLCWPPYGDRFARDCLDAYRGRTVVFVGEDSGGCTGGSDFFCRIGQCGFDGRHWDKEPHLKPRWRQVEEIAIPQWAGIHDSMLILERL